MRIEVRKLACGGKVQFENSSEKFQEESKVLLNEERSTNLITTFRLLVARGKNEEKKMVFRSFPETEICNHVT